MADPRHVLARTVERLRATGLTPVVAVELEFYLLQRDEAGRLGPARGLRSGRSTASIDAYGLGRLDDMSPLFDDLYAAARAQRLPARTLMSEYAPGQFEITLEHRADALRAVDEAVLFKRAIRGVASRHGCIACFMAKPFEGMAGTGMHLHASLADRQGRNAFASDDPAGTPLLRHAIGGLRATMADGMAVFAPARELVQALPRHELCAGGRHLGRQQSLGEPAHSGRATREPPRRASCRGRRREPLPRCGAGAGRHATRHRQRHRPRATCRRQRLRAGVARRPADGLARGTRAGRGRRSFSPVRSARNSSAYSSRSSGASTKNSVRWCPIGTTSGISTARDRCNISRCPQLTVRLRWGGGTLSQANGPVCES